MGDRTFSAHSDPAPWRLNPKITLRWRQLGQAWVVFETLSGQTHQLDNVAAAVLMCYEPGQALTLQQVLAGLQADFGLDVSAGGPAGPSVVATVVGQFKALGLIVSPSMSARLHAAV